MDSPLTCEGVSIWYIMFESIFLGPKSWSAVHKESIHSHFMFIFVETPYIYFSFIGLPFTCKGAASRRLLFLTPCSNVGCGGASVMWAQVGDGVAHEGRWV
jgi:hypothetical protein